MKRHRILAVVVLAAGLAVGRPAMAATIRTPVMQPGLDQMLVCTVVNISGKPLSMTAQLIDRWGENVTCFVRTDWDSTETVLLTLHAEATDPDARYCRVTLKGARKTAVSVSIQACTFDLAVCTAPVVGN